MKRICKQCGKEFALSQSEIKFYKEKNLTLPKRCKECRNANKQKKSGVKEPDRENREMQPKQAAPYGKENLHRSETASKRTGFGAGVCVLAIVVVLAFYAAGKLIPNWAENASLTEIPVQNQAETSQGTDTETDLVRTPSVDGAAGKRTEASADGGWDKDTAADMEQRNDILPELEQENGAADVAVQSVPDSENGSSLDDETVVEKGVESYSLAFRNTKLLEEHFQKHGIEMGFSSAEEYQAAAAAVVSNADSLHKLEAEDGDDVYYLESTNEFVIVSTDGYIRTYFNPDAGIEYYNKQ